MNVGLSSIELSGLPMRTFSMLCVLSINYRLTTVWNISDGFNSVTFFVNLRFFSAFQEMFLCVEM